MQLVFEICAPGNSGPRLSLNKTFDGAGGVIGRGAGCDWIIPDSSRLLSSHHALISYRDGRYFLTDISSNGIRLGGSGERLSKGQATPVVHGMVFQLGGFEVRASLVEPLKRREPETCLPALTSSIPDDAFLDLDPVRGLERECLSQNTSDELDALKLTVGEPGSWTDDCRVDTEHLTVPEWVVPAPETVPSQIETVPENGKEAFWMAFADALGIRLELFDEQGREALAIKSASLLRQGIEGLQQGLHTRNELKNELNLSVNCAQFKSQNPLQDSADCSAALKVLLGPGQLGQLSAELAVAQAWRDIQAHQVALLAACRAAMRAALAAFAPAHLIRCFEQQDKPPRFSTCGGHWRAYQHHYQRLIEDDCWSERLLGHDFAKAYEEQIRLISTLDRAYPG